MCTTNCKFKKISQRLKTVKDFFNTKKQLSPTSGMFLTDARKTLLIFAN